MMKLPTLNEKDAAKIARLVAGGDFVPVLNNTKWSELIESMLTAKDMKPQFRIRSMLAPPHFFTNWDGEWHSHIHPVAEIEWIELRAESTQWILSVLRKHNIPYSIEAGIPRVWGYTKPENQPYWK